MNEKLAAEKLYNVGINGKAVGLVADELGIEDDVLGSDTHSDRMSARKGSLASVKKSCSHLVKIVNEFNIGGIKVNVRLCGLLVLLRLLFLILLLLFFALLKHFVILACFL